MSNHEGLEHHLYKNGDKDAPDGIRDRNGEVAIGVCVRCGKAESQLSEPCEYGPSPPDSALRNALVSAKEALQSFATVADRREMKYTRPYFSVNLGIINGNVTQDVILDKLHVSDFEAAKAALAQIDAALHARVEEA